MESLDAVESEVEKVTTKLRFCGQNVDETLDDLIGLLNGLKTQYDKLPMNYNLTEAQTAMVNTALNQTKKSLGEISTEHRSLHTTVSKVGKVIDKNFSSVNELELATNSKEGEGIFKITDSHELLNQVVCEHFYHQGQFRMGDQVAIEGNLYMTPKLRNLFGLLHRILATLKRKDLGAAMTWTKLILSRPMSIQAQDWTIELEFKLRRLAFLELIKGGPKNQFKAVKYAQEKFPPFMKDHEKEIQVLMGTLAFIGGNVRNFPAYAHLFDETLWDEVSEAFNRVFCCFNKIPYESPVSTSVDAGCKAIPSLVDIYKATSSIHLGMADPETEVDLARDYHPVFVCPILRQQCSDANPPMRLVCGHAISLDALYRLPKVAGNDVKCPYCPVQQNPYDATEIKF